MYIYIADGTMSFQKVTFFKAFVNFKEDDIQ